MNEALQIQQRLFERIPRAFARDFLVIRGVLRLLNWLGQNDSSKTDDNLEANAFLFVPAHEQSFVRSYLEFVRGCTATDLSVRKDCLVSVVSIWRDLSPKNRLFAKLYYLCAAAWCDKFERTLDDSWREDWQNYVNQTDGNIPVWMFEVARRLEFQFPERAA